MVMGACYWCHWGWPKPIRDIYDDCVEKLGGDWELEWGPGHVVWGDENWDSRSIQWCLGHLDKYEGRDTGDNLTIVRESLERLLAVPDEFKAEPDGYDGDKHDPADFPPPKHWECDHR